MAAPYPDNPRPAVGGVVIWGGRVLLVRRGQPPSQGEWAIPGGSVELGESLTEAVEREILEETGVEIIAGEVCHVFDDIRRDDRGRVMFHYVIVDFLGKYVSGEPNPASDAARAGWFRPEDLEGLEVNRNTALLLSKIGFGRLGDAD
ncbi:MAG: NUDIX hydrolase [Pseudomonadota bacterium]